MPQKPGPEDSEWPKVRTDAIPGFTVIETVSEEPPGRHDGDMAIEIMARSVLASACRRLLEDSTDEGQKEALRWLLREFDPG